MPALARSMLPLFSLLYATFGCSDDSRSEKTHAATNHVIDAGPLGDHAAEGDTDAGDTDAGDTDAGDTDAGDTDAGDGDVGDDGEQVNEKDGGPGSRPGIDDGGVRPSDGGNGDGMNDATVESSPPGPLVCETAFPDYDCEFSRTAFRQTFDTLLQNECEDCHGTLGGTPPNLAFDAHDTLLPFINLEDVAASALIELIYGGHQCWQACDAAATEMRYLLEAWQWEFVLRERRLEELQDARERWAAANIDAYEWSIENGCFNCLHNRLQGRALAERE